MGSKSCRFDAEEQRESEKREKQRGFVDCRSLYLLVRWVRPRNTDRRCCCAKPAGRIGQRAAPGENGQMAGKWQRCCWRPAHRRTEKSVYISFRNRAEFKFARLRVNAELGRRLSELGWERSTAVLQYRHTGIVDPIRGSCDEDYWRRHLMDKNSGVVDLCNFER